MIVDHAIVLTMLIPSTIHARVTKSQLLFHFQDLVICPTFPWKSCLQNTNEMKD